MIRRKGGKRALVVLLGTSNSHSPFTYSSSSSFSSIIDHLAVSKGEEGWMNCGWGCEVLLAATHSLPPPFSSSDFLSFLFFLLIFQIFLVVVVSIFFFKTKKRERGGGGGGEGITIKHLNHFSFYVRSVCVNGLTKEILEDLTARLSLIRKRFTGSKWMIRGAGGGALHTMRVRRAAASSFCRSKSNPRTEKADCRKTTDASFPISRLFDVCIVTRSLPGSGWGGSEKKYPRHWTEMPVVSDCPPFHHFLSTRSRVVRYPGQFQKKKHAPTQRPDGNEPSAKARVRHNSYSILADIRKRTTTSPSLPSRREYSFRQYEKNDRRRWRWRRATNRMWGQTRGAIPIKHFPPERSLWRSERSEWANFKVRLTRDIFPPPRYCYKGKSFKIYFSSHFEI